MKQSTLNSSTKTEVQFYDCDPLGIVWHGNYVKYFEIGREAFCKKYNLDFLHIFNTHGFSSPLVNMDFSFKKPLTYKDIAIVEVTYKHSESAKLIFEYKIRKEATNELICTGCTTQVFVERTSQMLSLNPPSFYLDWQKQNQLL